MTSADLGGSQVCKDPYPHTYTAAGYEEARRCQLAAGHTGNHLWNSYSWEPTDLGGSGAGSTVVQWPDLSYLSPADREPYERIRKSAETMAHTIAQLSADLEAAQSEIAERDAQLAQALSERDEFRSMSRFSQKDEEAMDIIHRAADLLRDRGMSM